MEYETSDDSSNSENGSFTSESTIHEQEVISKKITKLKKRISEFEDISTVKEVTPKKGSKGNKVHTLEDKSSNYKNSNMATSKVKKGHIIEDESSDDKTTIKKAKNRQIINDFSSYNAEKGLLKQLKRRIYETHSAERLYRLCPTTEYHDMPLIEINKYIDKISETQDTTVPTNNRIKARKPNGNSKRAKKGKHVNYNAINTNESDTNLSKKNIGLALNSREISKIQDTTSSTNNRTSKPSRKKAKKGKQVDHNAPANNPYDNSKGTKKGKQVDHNTPIDVNESDPNDAKKGKQFDHNAPINIDESDPNLSEKNIGLILNIGEIEMLETQDTTAHTNSRTRAHKPKYRKHVDHNAFIDVDESDSNNNSKKATKGTRANHNSPIDFNEYDTNLSEKNIGSALNVGEITNNRVKDCKPKKGRNLESSKKLDKDLQ
ncbi:11301_t:CDS:2, partial [Scutellospora calospora]